MNNRFFSQEYIDDYNNKGIFPKIHDDIVTLISNFSNCNRAMDLGSCTGLLSLRLIEELGFEKCIGIEGNKNYIERAVQNPKLKYHNFYVKKDTLSRIENLINGNNINMVVCRRVLPEICNEDITIIHDLGKTLYDCNISQITIEGRVKTKNAKALLSNIDEEVDALDKYYYVFKAYKNCRLLKRREGV